MSDVLIRDVPPADLDRIRAAAAEQGLSVQGYLRAALRSQAAYLRRQDALSRIESRLAGHPAVSVDERDAVLAAVDAEDDRRSADLGASR